MPVPYLAVLAMACCAGLVSPHANFSARLKIFKHKTQPVHILKGDIQLLTMMLPSYGSSRVQFLQ